MSEPAIEHTAIEHTGRGPLSTDELAAVIGHDIPAGSYVNLGIGQPTKIADYLPTDENGNQAVILHTENGMLGMGPTATGDAIDPDLTNAGKVPVTELPGASYFHHADSFAMMRGGHLDVCVLGAYQVAANGDLANWHTGRPEDIPAVGGAMDLAIGAKDVYVMMTLFTKKGDAKLVQACTYPLTGLACVSRVYTDYATFDILTDGVHVLATYGISLADLRERVQVKLLALSRTTSAFLSPRPACTLPRCQPEGPRSRHPGQVQVLRVGVALGVEPDLVEAGELPVVTAHGGVQAGDVRLVLVDLDIGLPPPPLEADLHRLAGPQVPAPPERRTDQHVILVPRVGHRDGVAPARLAAHDVQRDEPAARGARQQRRAQQSAYDTVGQALHGQLLRPRVRYRG